ncbi:ferrous iron transport protein A [Iodobacter ciconiae]|uniref:Ferrous iron transport protein A n=2 Tax=Iodobacter ciconiae TaxID=2496266 RepID=A0A3S8ZXD0_9NEIS|nr:ferrous iron transport protein A [Iodobacter ciconiae]
MTLADLPLNIPARILSARLDADLCQRLAALGLHVQRDVQVIRRGVMGGPLQLRVGSTEFMLRRNDARQIVVDILPQAHS